MVLRDLHADPEPVAAVRASWNDVASACAAAAAAVRDAGYPLTSLYLEQGGRLRCYAVHGYGQFYDGILPGVGVIGRAFAEDRVVDAGQVRECADYWAAAEGVEHEIAVPVRMAGRCVGVLNVESRNPLPPSTRALLEDTAAELGRRLLELGGPPPESPAQQLVRHATSLAATTDVRAFAEALLEAATATSGLDSAVLLLDTPPRAVGHHGPAGPALETVVVDCSDEIVRWVQAGGSSRSSGEPAEPGALQTSLAQAGLVTFVLVPLVAGAELLGVLTVADEAGRVVPPAVVESLELLGALAAAEVRSLRSTQRLHEQARTDDLTGLPHRRSFTEALRDGVAGRRAGRCLAVVLLDLDHFKHVNDTCGHPAGDELLRRTAAVLAGALRSSSSELSRLGGDEFGTVLELDRPEDLPGVCERLLAAVRRLGATVSVGAVVVCDGEDEAQVVAAADVQLYLAKRRGRDRACVRP